MQELASYSDEQLRFIEETEKLHVFAVPDSQDIILMHEDNQEEYIQSDTYIEIEQ